MSGSLTAGDFPNFFRELHREDDRAGPEPFPWQRRLVNRVAETGGWPALLDLPTGSGKTAALDAAVFLLALRGDQPRRMVFVVDRRIVVHQAAERARHLAHRLQESREGVLFEVAWRLRDLADLDSDEPPLEYAELRGGIVRDNDWARRPDVPTVIVSTVDQVGSRLLFRGYGVSSGMRPVHAGLLGNDVLYLLDEVHLARPFSATLDAIQRCYRPPEETCLPSRYSVVELSATSGRTPDDGRTADDVLTLGADDRDPAVTPVLARRLTASKPARVKLVKVSGSDQTTHRAELATAAAGEARALLERPGVRTVGVVVNRVDTAARVHRLLDEQGIEAVLLTGRMRPLDRDRLLGEYQDRLRTGRARNGDPAPLVLVATQAIEAGADIDLDGLVTECAALDALIQRFGRVDRAGDCAARGHSAGSVILATSADVTTTAHDPVYGDRLRLTWEWLQNRPLDFGIDTFRIGVRTRRELSSPPGTAPCLMPSHLDRWVQTSATPDADPDPAHWLHGVQPASLEVNVVWRADVRLEVFPAPGASTPEEIESAGQRITSVVALCPPGSSEAMSLPLHAVRRWLAGLHSDGGGAAPSFSDTALHGGEETDAASREPSAIRPALSWRGDDSTVVTTATDIQPGSTLIVPATYGGIRSGNWDPAARVPVSDLGTAVQAHQRGRAVLRLYPVAPETDNDDRDRETVTDWLDELAEHADGPEKHADLRLLDAVVSALRNGRTPPEVTRVEIVPARLNGQAPWAMLVVRSRQRVFLPRRQRGPALERHRGSAGADSEPATSSFLGAAVPLDQHLSDVERWARRLGTACRLPDTIVADLALAGRLHDLGKVDERFQLILRGGEVVGGSEPLAKSAVPAADHRRRARAERAARYPRGTRHELASVALVEHDRALQDQANDWDLVLHLIASHHGYARPVVPVSWDPKPQQLRAVLDGRVLEACSDHGLLRLDSGVPRRFWQCVRRYGWYGLAWLEAVLRLADHRASEEREI